MRTQRNITKILFFVFLSVKAVPAFSNFYVIVYGTYDGNTGHAGIAVDRHEIVSHEIASSVDFISATDTITTGRLFYYDFWPKDDVFIRRHFSQNLEPAYYKLPQSSSEANITVHSLLRKGIPHKENSPVDGIIEIRTTPAQDLELVAYFDELINKQEPFNARTFNCVDFVIAGLNQVLHTKLSAREFVPFSFCSTPNKLFRKIGNEKILSTEIIADPGKRIRGSFFSQKVIPEAIKRVKKKLSFKT